MYGMRWKACTKSYVAIATVVLVVDSNANKIDINISIITNNNEWWYHFGENKQQNKKLKQANNNNNIQNIEIDNGQLHQHQH